MNHYDPKEASPSTQSAVPDWILTQQKIDTTSVNSKQTELKKISDWVPLVLFILILAFQGLLIMWQKRSYKTYQMASLFGLWIIPFLVSFREKYVFFLVIWTFFTVVNLFVLARATERPVRPETPRIVYKWFYFIYNFTYGAGALGNFILVLALIRSGMGDTDHVRITYWFDRGSMFFLYGLYFGVLGRDLADIITDKMAVSMGYYTSSGVPGRSLNANTCAVCGRVLQPVNDSEKVYKLNCQHTFHEFCIRGWCIIGKKQSCPYCREKVEMSKFFQNPWEKHHIIYGGILDFLRYLIVWQPIIIIILKFTKALLGMI